MYTSDYTAADFKLSGKKSTISRKNKLKHAGAKQIIQETRVCDYLALYTDEVNHIVKRAGDLYVLGLEFEEVKKHDSIKLSQFDPIVADYVKELKRKIAYANSKMLRSFRLKLSIQELTA